ncbi:Scramblase-domain-containing protein [Myxozyma melibiosi]|uniref:Phospholipid scramblase n=1 Tax=Myxozyma melibiosi TaxID=54550 RepID=A0ABR1FB09_9ASCO
MALRRALVPAFEGLGAVRRVPIPALARPSYTRLSPVSTVKSVTSSNQFSRSFASRAQIERSRMMGRRRSPSSAKRGDVYYPQSGTRVIYNHNSVLTPSDPISTILEQPALVIERQIEFMNIFLGFEQANRYRLMDIHGNILGYIEEVDFSFAKAIMRQIYRLHRPFTVVVYDAEMNPVLTLQRPFALINSRVRVSVPPTIYDDEPRIVGESHQRWHLWRRRYNLFTSEDGSDNFDQFAAIDAPILSFRFELLDELNRLMGVVSRNWVGLGRELFTDTGVYILQMDAADAGESLVTNEKAPGLTLDQRAVLLATAISIDYDYFSRHSTSGGGFVNFE